MKKLHCIMLVDDNPDDNFIHEREIKKIDLTFNVVVKDSGQEALEYLESATEPHVDLIFLDINMPVMNGWQFLHKYAQMSNNKNGRVISVMLTTSKNPDDIEMAGTFNFVSDYIIKPLTREKVNEIMNKYFNNADPLPSSPIADAE